MHGNPIKRVSSQFIFPGDGRIIKRGIVEITRADEVVKLIETDGDLPELGGQVFLNGFVIPAVTSLREIAELAGVKDANLTTYSKPWVVPSTGSVIHIVTQETIGALRGANLKDSYLYVSTSDSAWFQFLETLLNDRMGPQVILDCESFPLHMLGGLFFRLQEELNLNLHDILNLTVVNPRKGFGLSEYLMPGFKGPLAWLGPVDLPSRKLLPMSVYRIVE